MPKDDKGKGGGGVTSDPRFAAVHTDPRFQRFPKAKSKVQVDDRFAGASFRVCLARTVWCTPILPRRSAPGPALPPATALTAPPPFSL